VEPPDLLQSWTAAAGRLRGAARVAVFCDDDGTLLVAGQGSGEASLPPETARNLKRLSALRRVTLGILSGRPVEELRSLVPVDNAWYSGLYGHEIRNPQGLERRWYTRKEARRIADLAERLGRELSPVAGVRLVGKGGALVVDLGGVADDRLREVQESVLRVWKTVGKGLRLWPGPRQMELLASENRVKGTAVRFILGKIKSGTFPVYFGNDDTDLEAFRALRRSGLRIGVGGVVSPHLDFRLPDPARVGVALGRLADLLET